jgi:TolB-like protein
VADSIATERPKGAVFLSYASEDADAARAIAEALRAGGVEVWIDQSELRGGDAWDHRIRRQIRDCALFIPVISKNTQVRTEGYFRLEWRLADQRTHLMGRGRAFLLPVCVDDTAENNADVPDSFSAVQWTRLRGGAPSPVFIERVRHLLSPEVSVATGPEVGVHTGGRRPVANQLRRPLWRTRLVLATSALLASVAVAYLVIDKLWIARHAVSASAHRVASAATAAAEAAPFSPPPHSIAVLPFVNMSGDREQEYFSDGLTEELLNSLARIDSLQVAARTSSFSFKGKDTDIGVIARRLNVAALLEGSIRRSGNRVRITAQLINATSGFHLWSQSYDRELGDLLTLQSEIATAVAGALQVALLGDPAKKIELGGTRNPAAFDAYLHGWRLYSSNTAESLESSIAAFTEAIRLDPNYALAFAGRSQVLNDYSQTWATLKEKDAHSAAERAMADALHAVDLAADLADGHLALGEVRESRLDFIGARGEYREALALAPGYASVWRAYSDFAGNMGDTDSGVAAARRALSIDPLNPESLAALGWALYRGRRYPEALAAFEQWRQREPGSWAPHVAIGYTYYRLGDFKRAATTCEVKGAPVPVQSCLAMAYHKLGRVADAEASRARIFAAVGDAVAHKYAEIYAQWGDTPEALRWLEAAWKRRTPRLEALKTDPGYDPLRNEPRFQVIEKALKFPD